jgi:hypothetical protein
MGINGENLAIQHEFDKSSLIDLIGYSMNVAAKITSMTRPNKISIGNNVIKLLHPILQPEVKEMHLKKGTNKWKYIDLENNLLPYKVYTINKRFLLNYLVDTFSKRNPSNRDYIKLLINYNNIDLI